MELLVAIFVGLLGISVGSFLNVLLLRANTGQSISGRSRCLSCGIQLSAADLIPLASYLLLRGRCRHCGSRISRQYPLVEIGTMTLFIGAYLLGHHPALLVVELLMSTLLVFIVVYDIRHKIIPEFPVWLFTATALLHLAARSAVSATVPLPEELIAGPLAASVYVALTLLSRGRWMGLGDGKLAIGLGYLVGFNGIIPFVLISFWIGAIIGLLAVGVGYLTRGTARLWGLVKPLTMKSEVPFAPYLVFSALFVYVFDVTFDSLINFFVPAGVFFG